MFCLIHNTALCEERIWEPNLHQVIIADSEQGLYPDLIELGKGDTVIWFNQSAQPVRVRFLSGLGIVCYPIINFDGDVDGFFVSNEIPQGGFASLCLIQEGVFEYEVVRFNNEDQELLKGNITQGKVIVE